MKPICYKCKNKIYQNGENEYFTWFYCSICGIQYCLANDYCGTWSYLKHVGIDKWWVQCNREMDPINSEQVVFT